MGALLGRLHVCMAAWHGSWRAHAWRLQLACTAFTQCQQHCDLWYCGVVNARFPQARMGMKTVPCVRPRSLAPLLWKPTRAVLTLAGGGHRVTNS